MRIYILRVKTYRMFTLVYNIPVEEKFDRKWFEEKLCQFLLIF